jgi:hypothetical protein
MGVVRYEVWQVEVPDRWYDRLINGISRSLHRNRGQYRILQSTRISTTLRNVLALPLELNARLTGLGITTPTTLRQTSEAELREMGLSWQQIRTINLRLSAANLSSGLRGRKIHPDVGLETLDIGPSLYGLLREKNKGINSLDQLLAMDAIGITTLDGGRMELLEVLKRQGLTPAPLGPKRTVGDLLWVQWTPEAISDRGFDPTILIRGLTVAGIRALFARLEEADGASVAADYRVGQVKQYLEFYGSSLPDE